MPVSTNPPQPARGVPRVRDPEVVEGPTRPICPPSDPVSCLPHPRDVVPAPLPYQDITHRTRNRLTTPLRVAGELPSPLLCMWVLFSGSPGRHPTGGGGIDLYVRRFARDAERARLGRFVVVCVVESVGLRRARSARRLHFFSSLAASSFTSLQAVTSPSSRTRTRRGATSRDGRLLPRSRPWQ